MAQPQPALAQTLPSEPSAPVEHPRLRERSIALVGLPGAGKSTVGRGLATALGLPFRDADQEIERAAQRTVAEIFAEVGEPAFRDGERRVIARLLAHEPPHVLATGGGAFVQPATREVVRDHALSVWLKVDVELLVRRVSRKTTRPLLIGRDPREVLEKMAADRYPHYAEADLVVETGEASAAAAVAQIVAALNDHLHSREPLS
jgi:shikimate kinase